MFKAFSMVSVLAMVLSASVSLADAAVSFQDAPKYYNQTKTIEGTVVGTFCDDKRCFLNFHEDFRKYVSAVIDSADFAKFSKAAGKEMKADLDKMYTGKKVQITGAITEYKSKSGGDGRPQIMLTDSAKIKVLAK